MKSFFQFLSEVTSTASQQAARMNLKGDGHATIVVLVYNAFHYGILLSKYSNRTI